MHTLPRHTNRHLAETWRWHRRDLRLVNPAGLASTYAGYATEGKGHQIRLAECVRELIDLPLEDVLNAFSRTDDTRPALRAS